MVHFSESPAPIKKIKHVQFGLFSPEEIRKMSVVKVEFPEVYENGIPKLGGLLDPRMGTNDRATKCLTCSENMTDCCGHFGHIELAKPIFHVGFLPKIKKILEIVCFHCSHLRCEPPLVLLLCFFIASNLLLLAVVARQLQGRCAKQEIG